MIDIILCSAIFRLFFYNSSKEEKIYKLVYLQKFTLI